MELQKMENIVSLLYKYVQLNGVFSSDKVIKCGNFIMDNYNVRNKNQMVINYFNNG